MVAPSADVRWLHVCDRGADDYEVYCRAFLNNCGWVIRAAHMNRIVQTVEGEKTNLKILLQSQTDAHRQTVEVPRQGNRQSRTAEVTIRFESLSVEGLALRDFSNSQLSTLNSQLSTLNSQLSTLNSQLSTLNSQLSTLNSQLSTLNSQLSTLNSQLSTLNSQLSTLLMWVVELKVENPPQGAESLHWVLLTSEPITNVEEALQVIGFYGKRWGVKEYHKVLKTGCRVEKRYYETAERLERMTGMLAVLAIRLLQIRTISEEEPDRPAVKIVPRKWVKVLSKVRKRATEEMTIHQFVRHLGGLGGHLGRKCDGHLGWITLWRGLEKLLLILRGTTLQKRKMWVSLPHPMIGIFSLVRHP